MSNRPMCVKELGPAIGRSVWYVYRMRLLGFRMPAGVARPSEALAWVEQTGFKIIHGRPLCLKVQKGAKLTL